MNNDLGVFSIPRLKPRALKTPGHYSHNNGSLLEVENVIIKFEQATGAILNKDKTKIFGLGKWKDRVQWPLLWLKVESQYFYTLGIYHSNAYASSVEKNWSNCLTSLQLHKQMLSSRKLTLFQRVTYANSCMLSKLWYISHIYPLSQKYAKEINKVIFNYVWSGRYEPIRRSTVFRPKQEGGLGIINCLIKSQIIMLNSFIKCIIDDDYCNSLQLYYSYIRMHNIMPLEYSIHNAALTLTPYYENIYNTIKKVLHIPGYPIIPKKRAYMSLLPKEKSYTEDQ